MNVLEKIIKRKKEILEKQKSNTPIGHLERSQYFHRDVISLAERFKKYFYPAIISEFKRKSPSKGVINAGVNVDEVTRGYAKAGAIALSVLTDHEFFGGNPEDLEIARSLNEIPILRKDFIVDEYQLIEAKSIGADVILLIAAALGKNETIRLAKYAKSLNLDVLLEIHDEQELVCLNEYVDIVGVNNRNLGNFHVSIETSLKLADKIPPDFIRISESGIDKPSDIHLLYEVGYKGFLIGECFMKEENPVLACQDFIKKLMVGFPNDKMI